VISCEAQPESPGATLLVTGWTFSDEAGDVVARDDASGAQTTWSGQLVVNGTIVVTGTVNGQAATGVANVTVTPRDWSTKAARKNRTTPGADGLPLRPTSFHGQLGSAELSMRVRLDVQNYVAVIQDGGPNNEFMYMTDIPYETVTVARVNYPAMTVGSDWYRIQYERDKTVRGIRYCGQPRVLTLVPLVEAHEGTEPDNQPNSHIGIYERDVDRDSRIQAERLAGPSSTLNPNPPLLQIHNAAAADAAAMDSDSRNNINSSTLPCVFTYDYSRLP
jgi:hypothetical protein